MSWKAQVKGRLDGDKGQMKLRLLEWGDTQEQCRRRQEKMKQVMKFREEQKALLAGNDSETVAKLMEEIDRKYEREMEGLQGEILERLEQKRQTEELLQKLGEEEQRFVELRFEKGHGFDYISMKMCISRATLFRMQDKILEKLAELAEDETA